MKTSRFCACLLTRLKSFGLCTALRAPDDTVPRRTGCIHLQPPKCAHHKVWFEKIFRPARNIAASYGNATKDCNAQTFFTPQQWCHFTAYDSDISSFKIRPISVHWWNFVLCRIYPLLDSRPVPDLRALLNSKDCWNLWNSHVMISSFCNYHATFVAILRHHAIYSKLGPHSKNANRKKR